jgi:hypothetical protein
MAFFLRGKYHTQQACLSPLLGKTVANLKQTGLHKDSYTFCVNPVPSLRGLHSNKNKKGHLNAKGSLF